MDIGLAGLAIDAFETWGRDKAALNFGDCFSHALVTCPGHMPWSHALAVARGTSLLFVGDDFSQTGLPKA